MNPVLRRWSVLAWPIWAKLLAGLLLASFVPLLVVGLLASDSFQSVAAQNIRQSMSRTGVALAALTELLFGPLWGSLSDRVGRKPILLVGVLGPVAPIVVGPVDDLGPGGAAVDGAEQIDRAGDHDVGPQALHVVQDIDDELLHGLPDQRMRMVVLRRVAHTAVPVRQ